jgi:hypothetical protein
LLDQHAALTMLRERERLPREIQDAFVQQQGLMKEAQDLRLFRMGIDVQLECAIIEKDEYLLTGIIRIRPRWQPQHQAIFKNLAHSMR